jgi:hypothetical protein
LRQIFACVLTVVCIGTGVKNVNKFATGIFSILSLCWLPLSEAAPITSGNLVIYRVGSGANTLANTGNNVFLDEYTTAGVLVQSIEMPSTGAGTKLVSAGNANAEGPMSISPDGKWIGFTGYNSTISAASSITSATSAAVPRVAGILNTETGTYSLTAMGTFFSAASPRSAVTNDGNKIWAVGGNSGVVYGTVDGSTPFVSSGTTANTTSIGTNIRVIGIFGNELYQSTASGTLPTVGLLAGDPLVNGLPTASTFLPNIPRSGGTPVTSRYGFVFLDLDPTVSGDDTLYVVDDSATSGGIWKYAKDSTGTWNSKGSITAVGRAIRGITAKVDGTQVQLFMTAVGNTLHSYTDTNAVSSTLTGTVNSSGTDYSPLSTLVTAASNTAFRGVTFVPGAPTAYTHQQQWRFTNFGSYDSLASAADSADPDGDGLNNLLEYALGLNPNASGTLPASLVLNGANLEYSYTRSTAAKDNGVVYQIEWSDTLETGSWSTQAVSEQITSTEAALETVKASIPADSNNKRFLRLRVTGVGN